MEKLFRFLHPFMVLPYFAVLTGLYLFRSAWLAILFYHAGMALYLACVHRNAGMPPIFKGWNSRAGVALSLLCASGGLLLYLIWPVAAIDRGALASTLEALGLHGTGWRLFVFYYLSLHPVIEEAFWRGAHLSGQKGIIPADAAFAGYHILVLICFIKTPWTVTVFLILVLTAWLWRRITLRYGGLAIPIISHAAAGFGTMAAVCCLLS